MIFHEFETFGSLWKRPRIFFRNKIWNGKGGVTKKHRGLLPTFPHSRSSPDTAKQSRHCLNLFFLKKHIREGHWTPGVPCGLFVPSLYVGACLGRCLGVAAAWANSYLNFADEIHPGDLEIAGEMGQWQVLGSGSFFFVFWVL